MIFNLEKNNNRDMIDKGDLKSCLLMLSSSTRLHSPTVAVIVKLLDFLSENFNRNQPKDKTVIPTYIVDYNLLHSLNKVYKSNCKLDKKRKKKKIASEELQGIIDLEPKPVDEGFNSKQVNQIKALNQEQNELMQKLLLELAKTIKTPAVKETTEEIAKNPKGSKK